MQLHLLKPSNELKAKKPRVGRGGKRGTFSGRGTKGQKARAGRRMRPAERELIQRLPKLRGVKHKGLGQKLPVLNVGDLDKIAAANDGVISEKTLGRRVKILGEGEIKTPIVIKALLVSKTAKEKIEKAGGKIIK